MNSSGNLKAQGILTQQIEAASELRVRLVIQNRNVWRGKRRNLDIKINVRKGWLGDKIYGCFAPKLVKDRLWSIRDFCPGGVGEFQKSRILSSVI